MLDRAFLERYTSASVRDPGESADTHGGSEPPMVAGALGLVRDLSAAGVEARLMGGVGIAVRSPSMYAQPLARGYDDVDFVTDRIGARLLHKVMPELGFVAAEQFNALQGSRRLLFGRAPGAAIDKVDVFIERVDMCHTIDLGDRLRLHSTTLSLADLLLLKLQIVELNEKDVRDVAALLLDHEVGRDEDVVNAAYLGELCAGDWGLWKTVTISLDRLQTDADRLVPEDSRRILRDRFDALRAAIEEAPRTRKWKLRARVGERVRWYELPEEVDR
jgi:hypothetical protein